MSRYLSAPHVLLESARISRRRFRLLRSPDQSGGAALPTYAALFAVTPHTRGTRGAVQPSALARVFASAAARALLALASTFAVLLVLGAGPAEASFLPAGSVGSSGSGPGQFGFGAPLGAAVDQSTGDVYFTDTIQNRVEKFDSSGNFLLQFGSPGSGSGQFSDVSGMAVDQSNGDVYVADLQGARVEKFDSSGNFLLTFGTSGSGSGQFAGGFGWLGNVIAVDSSGHVYVADTGNARVEKFDSQGNYLSTISTNLSSPVSVAVDPAGNVYVADSGSGAVEKYDSSGTFVTPIGAGTSPTAVTTDPAGDLFVFANSPNAEILEYDPSGTQIDSFGSGVISWLFVNPGIAFSQALDGVYVSQPNTSDGLIFRAPVAPSVDRTYSSNVTANTATLNAQINPDGADTTFHFEYGTTTGYGSTTPESTSIGATFGDQAAGATITGLANNTTYHYRVVAHNSLGTTNGPDGTFTTFPPAGPRALPDNRAYEQVSPPDKNNYDIRPGNAAVAPTGNSATFFSLGAFAGNQANDTADQYLASRGPNGWTTQGVNPSHAPDFTSTTLYQFVGFSSDLTRMVLENGDQDGATPGTVNLFRRDADGSLQLLTPNTPPADSGNPLNIRFDGGSSDFSNILFDTHAALLPGASNNEDNLYEWVNGSLSLIGPGLAAGAGGSAAHAISDDGSRIYYSDSSASAHIYLRQNGSSTEITTSQCTSRPSCATGSATGTYWTASTDGSKALFTSNQQLTSDSTAVSTVPFGDLYEYGASTGQLTDLSPDATDPQGADVQGVVGASDDGSYVYFVANGVLASGATRGSCAPLATQGICNLYLWHNGTTKLIATLGQVDHRMWDVLTANPLDRSLSAQVSDDGLHLLFTSVRPLTSYDNAGHSEVYRYDAASGKLTCVSCNPSGAAAAGDAELAASSTTGSTSFNAINNMSADGTRVFFETNDALLPQDTNGTEDVYEWEANGNGSCHSSADNGGCLYLISSGQSSSPSYFANSTPSGGDAFFLTREQLVGQDTDNNVDLYDARVSGGFPAPASAPTPCSGEACLGQPASAPAVPVAASVTFFGPGNTSPAVGSSTRRVRVLSRIVHGATFIVRVQVPARGRLTVSGAAIRTVGRRLAKAGTYAFRVSLTPKARAALRHQHKLKVRIRVLYSPVHGPSSSVAITLIAKPTGRGRRR